VSVRDQGQPPLTTTAELFILVTEDVDDDDVFGRTVDDVSGVHDNGVGVFTAMFGGSIVLVVLVVGVVWLIGKVGKGRTRISSSSLSC